MARPTMAAMIARVRGLIADPAGASQHFTDDQIEGALDRRSREIVELPLIPVPARTSTGAQVRMRWVSDRVPFETGATVLNSQSVPVTTGFTADEMDGIWIFAASQDAVYITGLTFDLYGASADLLDQWLAEGISSGGAITEWETDGQRVKRGASATTDRVSLANLYRRQSLPVTAFFSGGDFASSSAWTLRG